MMKSIVARTSRQVTGQTGRIARQGEFVDPKAAIAMMKKTQRTRESFRAGSSTIEERFSGEISAQIERGTAPSAVSADPKDEMWSPLRSNKP
ncbi:hypothetical protein K493DRAFT_320032 [Basidiobolus meristosporus CBS 931.73]|uniref:Uncharacterized protein n=1 Tax=Basidiobolus meristosporus CBS 931.73 TaxID=1314790 RepID=A0A1Y1XGU0_9FUNG|nr:hypothetical protein K493DRAFT_320032 [Basidiobolus meristosporus CBS 931.73]|eukprot:ORX84978.1 hypothetical protein K493DRAFT_320032 [Basidiobolus meristosporus CBS 931.73]